MFQALMQHYRRPLAERTADDRRGLGVSSAMAATAASLLHELEQSSIRSGIISPPPALFVTAPPAHVCSKTRVVCIDCNTSLCCSKTTSHRGHRVVASKDVMEVFDLTATTVQTCFQKKKEASLVCGHAAGKPASKCYVCKRMKVTIGKATEAFECAICMEEYAPGSDIVSCLTCKQSVCAQTWRGLTLGQKHVLCPFCKAHL